MEAQAMVPATFGQLKASKFNNIPKELCADIQYVEQLAASTNTNIDEWMVIDMLAGIKPGDRRAINKIFFNKLDSKPAVDPAALATMAPIIDKMNGVIEAIRKARLKEFEQNRDYYLTQAAEYAKHWQNKMREAAKMQTEAEATRGMTEFPFKAEIEKILANPFWRFEKVSGANETVLLHFSTASNMILVEKNPKAGVNRRVDLGQFEVRFCPTPSYRSMGVYPYKNNTTVSGHYHPYVSASGSICWGNASNTAAKHMSNGEWAKTMELLAALLSNFSPDTTPYVRLVDFDAVINRGSQVCEWCEETGDNCDCELCDLCERPEDGECTCSYCEPCDQRFREGSSCDGYYCEVCEECAGRERCQDHWCDRCEEYYDDHYHCDHCGRLDEDCERCRECDSHGGHETRCSNAPQPEREATF